MQIGLYFHIPFCASKCYYCDFLSFPKKEEQTHYVEALIKEIEKTSEDLPEDMTIKSIFIGGGTPTVLPPFLLDQLMQAITSHFKLESDCEWTIEANPGTLEEDKIQVLNKYPITRISLGLQSTHDELLKRIGRRHTFKDWEESIALIKKYTNWAINTDLMFALPGQSLEDFQTSLEKVANYDLEHVSVYALIIEDGTYFGDLYEAGQLQEVSDELDRQMYHLAQAYLKEKGYEQYEISNWCKPGKACQHNLVYWRCEPYLGLGLGAHSLFDDRRYYNEEEIKLYIENSSNLSKIRNEEEKLTRKALIEEYIFLGLRLTEGIHLIEFEKKFGESIWNIYEDNLKKWIELGVMIQEDNRIYLSSYGLDVCNEVLASFL